MFFSPLTNCFMKMFFLTFFTQYRLRLCDNNKAVEGFYIRLFHIETTKPQRQDSLAPSLAGAKKYLLQYHKRNIHFI